MPAGEIKVQMHYNALTVSFGGVTHLRIDATKYVGHQSWRQGYGDRKFVIEFTMNGGTITPSARAASCAVMSMPRRTSVG